ncbi:pyridoxamine 5'-phosphate oxidase family protein [Halorarius halobius]|uniref:pyridoxamine 5'-phosphate oxidase family protein n=1 Tax=Halorarius halobius TaxID=2962671 RepID=UPI0020CF40FD|nr:pyridoxamine 5'-phosphate oxidase family protein [Halorarius halobius]
MDVVEDSLGVDIGVFLARPLFAHLATRSPEGPRESPVWYLWEDGSLWIDGDRDANSFTSRVARDERVAVGIVDSEPRRGLIQHVGMRGTAEVVPFDRDRATRLYERYLGSDVESWDPRFQSYIRNPAESSVFVRVDPETVVARDQSYAPAPGR